MSRVTSLTAMSDRQLNRWIRIVGLALLIGTVAFAALYAVDRFRAPSTPLADREVAAMEEAVRADPTDIAARGRLADLYFAAKRYDDAIVQYSEIIKSGMRNEAAYVSRGRAHELTGDLDAAAADYTKVVEIASGAEIANVDPMLQTAYYGLGSIALAQSRPADAIDPLVKALAIKRTDADAMTLLGEAYVKAGQPDNAVEPLRRAILFVPTGWADPYQSLAAAYAATGKTAEAEWAGAMAQAMGATAPGAAPGASPGASTAPGASPDAADATDRLLAIADGDAAVDARIGLGLLAEQAGDNSTAASWYRKALERDAANQAAKLGLSRVSGDTTQGHPDVAPSASAGGNN